MDFNQIFQTEIVQYSEMIKDFREMGCEILACSVDSQFSHMEYAKKDMRSGGLGQLEIPLLSDMSHSISKSYGCLITSGPK
jgi:alkyl hydroperoxide reductase subunit AhpC